MSVVEILSLSLAIISSLTALISLAIVFWDHFYDDKILSRQVKGYYENIEGVIFTFYRAHSLVVLIKEGNAELEDQHFGIKKQWAYFMGNFKKRFDDFSKYFGLTLYGNYVITQSSPFCVEFEGQMHKIVQEIPRANYRQVPMFKTDTDTGDYDFSGKIHQIDAFLNDLREHWNINFSKRLFRKKLKPVRNFDLLASLPIIKIDNPIIE